MASKKFLSKMKVGAFTRQAKQAGMGVQQFARHVIANKEKYDARTIRRAYIALRAKRGWHKPIRVKRRR